MPNRENIGQRKGEVKMDKIPPIYIFGLIFSLFMYFYFIATFQKRKINGKEMYAAIFLAPLASLLLTKPVLLPVQPILSVSVAHAVTIFLASVLFVVAHWRKSQIESLYLEHNQLLKTFLVCVVAYLADLVFSGFHLIHCEGRCEFIAPIFGYPAQLNFVSFAACLSTSALTIASLTVKFGRKINDG